MSAKDPDSKPFLTTALPRRMAAPGFEALVFKALRGIEGKKKR